MSDHRLFEEFPPIETSQWMEVVTKDLKGQEFAKRLVSTTEDGVEVRPIYRKEDLPAEMPSARGESGDGRKWAMREEVRSSTPSEANAHALRALESGAEELAVFTYPIGSFVRSLSEVRDILNGVYIEMAPIHWMSGPFSPAILRIYSELVQERGLDPKEIKGSVDLDPLTDRAAGWVAGDLESWKADFVETLKFAQERLPSFGSFVVRGALFEKAGASHAQEIAFAAAVFVEYLDAFEGSGLSLEESVAKAEIRLGVGPQYLLEIAKMRAARVVFANILKAYGTAAQPKFHAITTGLNKTIYDPHNNLLRSTIEAMAGVIGGADSLSVAAFDQATHPSDEFSRHLARNTEILLKEEAHLDKVADPLGGAYAIENLTASIAQAAWELFNKVQEKGGFSGAWGEGFIQAELLRVRKAKEKAAATRRTPLVGTSIFPNLKERRAQDVESRPEPLLVSPVKVSDTDLDQKLTSITAEMGALSPLRLAEPYENLRLSVERGGRTPVVQMLLTGSVVMRKARAGFCLGFFGAGGLDVRESVLGDELPEADLYVLCSSDEEYLAAADKVFALEPKAPVWVAGLPSDSVEALKAKGVADFVHVRLNPIEVLSNLLPTMGVSLIGGAA